MLGGMYILGMHWSTDGGDTYGYENTKYRYVQLPYNNNEVLSPYTYGNGRVTAKLETGDFPSNTALLNTWLSNMDKVYGALQELTNHTPYGGSSIELLSTRDDMNQRSPDNQNYWELTWGLANNPVFISRPFYRSLMLRLSNGDWGDVAIHELAHGFDTNRDEWRFDSEVLADLKLSYVLETLSGSKIYRPDTKTYYTGNNIYDFFNTDQIFSYNNTFGRNSNPFYHNRGMTAIMLRIKQSIGWQPFKDTFRYMANLSEEERDYIYAMPRQDEIGKFNIFMTKLNDFSSSNINVFNLLTTTEKSLIGAKYGGTVAPYTAPPPNIGGGGQSNINLPIGQIATRRFTPTATANYNIFTAPYAGVGAENDTIIEVFSDENFNNLVDSNDDYGGSRFSNVLVYLEKNQTYYIRVKHFNSSTGSLHTDLKISKTPVNLRLNSSHTVETSDMEMAIFRYQASTGGQYIFKTGPWNGSFQSGKKEIILKLYSDEALTKLIGTSTYQPSTFPQISCDLQANEECFVTFEGYLGRPAEAQIWVAKMADAGFTGVSDMIYNWPGYNSSEIDRGNALPMLGYGNSLKFTLNGGTAGTSYYIVPALRWENAVTPSNKPEAGDTVTLDYDSTKVTLNKIDLTSTGHSKLYTRIRLYPSKTSYNSNPTQVPIWESGETGFERSSKALSNIKFERETGGSTIVIHNPETISDAEIIQPEKSGHTNNLIYSQSNITGYNTVYVTHSTKLATYNYNTVDQAPKGKFIYDIDFYIPPGQGEVTINIRKPYDAIKYNWGYKDTEYMGLRKLLLDRLWDDYDQYPTIALTINSDVNGSSGVHMLLYRDIYPQLFQQLDELTKELAVNPVWFNDKHSYLGIFLDFTVQSGKNITLSSLAAYEQVTVNGTQVDGKHYLTLTGNSMPWQAGTSNQVSIYGAPILYDGRSCEPDLNIKPNGRDTAGIDVLSTNMSYIIDDNVADGNLYINNQDPYWGTDVAYKSEDWVPQINGFVEAKVWLMRRNFPSILSNFQYKDDSGVWLFGPRYTISGQAKQGFMDDIPNNRFNMYYMIGVEKRNYTFTNAIWEDYKNFVHGEPMNVEQEYLEQISKDHLLIWGNYGIKHRYTIDIHNTSTTTPRTLKYNIWLEDYFATITYVIDKKTGQKIKPIDADTNSQWSDDNLGEAIRNIDGTSYPGGGDRRICKVLNIKIPPGAQYEIHNVNMYGVGTQGLKNELILGH